jgi:membrane protein YqaA with SNARE-associated domain
MEYIGLFFSALIASTLLPMGSEFVLVALLNQGGNTFMLWLVATLGNSIGSCINYVLGFWASDYINNKYHATRAWQQAKTLYKRYGIWSLLFAWLPIVGDPLTLLAGLAQTKFRLFVLLVVFGKGARYALLISLSQFANSSY